MDTETETVRVNRPQGPIHTEPKRKRREKKENYKTLQKSLSLSDGVNGPSIKRAHRVLFVQN